MVVVVVVVIIIFGIFSFPVYKTHTRNAAFRRDIKTQLFLVSFYRAMLSIRGTSHWPVSVCLSVRHKSVFYQNE